MQKELSHISGRDFARMKEKDASFAMDAADYRHLANYGVNFPESFVRAQIKYRGSFAMDDQQGGITSPSVPTPLQFLQTWLPGFARGIFAPRKIDEFVGLTTVGKWHDEEVVQGLLENIGNAEPYGDYTNVPLASWNAQFERRTIVRFEKGFKVGRLDQARSAEIQVDTAAERRISVSNALDIQRNLVGFFGYNNGANRTYGLLNDPSLPAYISVPAGAGGGTEWSGKTYLEITADIRQAMYQLEVQSQGNIDPRTSDTVLGLPVGTDNFLSVVSQFGNSVQQWLRETYPRCRPVTAPQLAGANGGDNVMYLYAEKVEDGATDDSRVWVQVVPAKFQALGVEQQAKGYVEDFTNATAGVMCKRPYAVVRYTGI